MGDDQSGLSGIQPISLCSTNQVRCLQSFLWLRMTFVSIARTSKCWAHASWNSLWLGERGWESVRRWLGVVERGSRRRREGRRGVECWRGEMSSPWSMYVWRNWSGRKPPRQGGWHNCVQFHAELLNGTHFPCFLLGNKWTKFTHHFSPHSVLMIRFLLYSDTISDDILFTQVDQTCNLYMHSPIISVCIKVKDKKLLIQALYWQSVSATISFGKHFHKPLPLRLRYL